MTAGHSIVVGGTFGHGRALVRRVAALGHRVSVLGRRVAPLVDQACGAVASYSVDLSVAASVTSTVARVIEEHGHPQSVVFYQRYRGPGNTWDGELAVSLTATRLILEQVLAVTTPALRTSVVVIGSIADHLIADEQDVAYHVSKAALAQMVRYFAVTGGPRGLRINGISPGSAVKAESESFYDDHPQLRALCESIIPLGRLGTSDDIAELALFLLDDRSSYLTGQCITLDGGLSLRWQESLARGLGDVNALRVTR